MILMKNGQPVPEPLLSALEADGAAKAAFARMSPSCQKRYARHVTEAKKEETQRRRVPGVLAQIREYGESHPPPKPEE